LRFGKEMRAKPRRIRTSTKENYRQQRHQRGNMRVIVRYLLFTSTAVLVILCRGFAQNTPTPDSSTFDSDGTAHVTRVVPMPTTVSPEAQQWLKEIEREPHQSKNLAELRKGTDEWRKRDSDEACKRFPVKITETTTAGVRTDIIEPIETPESHRNRVLINLH